MKIAELFARIGLKTDEHKAKSFDRSLGSVRLTMIAAATAAVAFTFKLRQLTDQAFMAAAGFKQFEAETGASSESLQRWQSVAQATNNSAQAVLASVKAIAENQAAIRLGQGNISGYQLIGIDPRQDPFEILEQLRQKTQGLSQSMKRNVLSQIGVSAELIQVLELTNAEFDRMARNAFVLSPEAIASLDNARASTQEVGMAFRWLRQMIAAELSPSIEELNRQVVEWIRNNKEGIVKTIRQVFDWVQRFVTMISRGVTMLDRIIVNTIGWEKALLALIGVIALMNASFLLSPLGLFVAGIVLLLAVLEDLYVYSLKGEGRSLFGYIMENFPQFANILNPIIGAFNSLAEAVALIFAGDKEGFRRLMHEWGLFGKIILGIIDLFNSLKEAIKLLFAGDKEDFLALMDEWGAFGDVIKGIVAVMEKLKALQEWFAADPVAEQAIERVDPIIGAGSIGVLPIYDFNAPVPGDQSDFTFGQKVQNWFSNLKDDIAEFGLIGAFGQPSNGSPGNVNTFETNIEINGATDPIETGEEVKRRMQEIFNQRSAQTARDE